MIIAGSLTIVGKHAISSLIVSARIRYSSCETIFAESSIERRSDEDHFAQKNIYFFIFQLIKCWHTICS